MHASFREFDLAGEGAELLSPANEEGEESTLKEYEDNAVFLNELKKNPVWVSIEMPKYQFKNFEDYFLPVFMPWISAS